MQFKHSNNTFVLRMKTGEEIVEILTIFLAKHLINSGIIFGIGAVYDVTLNYFNMETKEYEEKHFSDNYEILSLMGNIALKDNHPFAHLHITLGSKNYECIGGHLKSAKVGATCEIVVKKLCINIDRVLDKNTGLFLLNM